MVERKFEVKSIQEADGEITVEVLCGSKNYIGGVTLLSPKYLGDCVVYTSLIEAMETASKIAKAYKKDTQKERVNVALIVDSDILDSLLVEE